nr:MAG TPA: putative restriction endonuclease [Caudoviricetes sp.]
MNKGYIGVTDNNWAKFIKDNSISKANFWCKKHSFKAIENGDIFFFLKKNNAEEKKEKLERKIVGYGIFKKFEVLTIEDAWNIYGVGNGCSNIKLFSDKINNMYELNSDEAEIGSIILDEIVMFEEPIYLSKIGIVFSNSIVSGKTITIEEVNAILNSIDVEIDYIEEDENLNLESLEFDEGEQIKRVINSRKRNKKARELKFEQVIKRDGKVVCEVCSEDDIVALDVHHDKVEVSDMEKGHKTKLSDLRILCSNCHRKVHGYKLTVDELIIKNKV